MKILTPSCLEMMICMPDFARCEPVVCHSRIIGCHHKVSMASGATAGFSVIVPELPGSGGLIAYCPGVFTVKRKT